VLVEGRVVVEEGRVTGVDMAGLRDTLEDAMQRFRHDQTALLARQAPAFPWLLAANRRIAESGQRFDRFIPAAAGDS
jgi:hypothetical protein